MLLIGVTGPSGAHKTDIVDRLRRAHGFSAFHAGDPVKRALKAGLALPNAAVDGTRKDRPDHRLGGAVSRELMEATGDKWHEVAPHATAMVIERRATKRMSKGRDVVIDGVRTPVEASAIRRMGGVIIRANHGKGPDPEKPMDMRQAAVSAEHEINTSDGTDEKDRKANTKAMTDQTLERIAAQHRPFTGLPRLA